MNTKKADFWRITFDTNPDDCNLSCIMCETHSPYSCIKKDRVLKGLPPRRMDIELIERVLTDMKHTELKEIIPSTMGEPLLYKDFDKIIDLCKRFGVKLNVITNGTFPIKGVKEWAELLIPITSDIKISWNGATKGTQERIMLNSKFERGINNIKEFIRIRDEYASTGGNRCKVTLQLTFMEININELPDIVRLGIKLGIDRIKGHHLWTHFDEIKHLSMRRDISSIKRWNETVQIAKRIANENFLSNGKLILLENFDELSDDATINLIPDGVCPFLKKEAWVDTHGRFSPCCAPDNLRRTLGEFGNLYEDSIHTIWNSDAYQNLCQTYLKYPVCIGCNMRRKISSNCKMDKI